MAIRRLFQEMMGHPSKELVAQEKEQQIARLIEENEQLKATNSQLIEKIEALERELKQLQEKEKMAETKIVEEPKRKSWIEEYNEGKFDALYRDGIRFGVTNAVARYSSLKIPPDFQRSSDGDYIAMSASGGRYEVVPRSGLTFQESIFNPGAMGEVFDCPGYDSEFRYRAIKVKKPAIFTLTGNSWKLIQKGELELGQPIK